MRAARITPDSAIVVFTSWTVLYFQLGLNRIELALEAKFASGSSSRSFYGPLAAWDKDSGEIYPVETDLKLAMIMLVLEDQKKPAPSGR